VGVFAPEQDAAAALRTVALVAAAAAPFELDLGGVERFANSAVFYCAIRNTAPLVDLHQRLVGSGLRFLPSQFPFSPHLTIDTFEDASPALVAELLALPVPAGPHRIESLSVYSLHGWDCRLIERFALGRSTT
jgi:2'-5' RNA ligase